MSLRDRVLEIANTMECMANAFQFRRYAKALRDACKEEIDTTALVDLEQHLACRARVDLERMRQQLEGSFNWVTLHDGPLAGEAVPLRAGGDRVGDGISLGGLYYSLGSDGQFHYIPTESGS